MPNGMNGIELARFAAKRYPTMKIILASGYTLPSLRAQYDDIDKFAFMSKPYRMSDLARKLRGA
jgi:DNA-binding LytR/AlgR family response regulator